MQLQALVALLTLIGSSNAHQVHNAQHARLAKRATVNTVTTTVATTSHSSSAAATSSASSLLSMAATTSASASLPSVSSMVGTGIPPLSQLTSGMPSPSTLPPTATYSGGASPPVSGVPPLPSPTFVYKNGDWPTQDQVPPTNSSEVQQWMKELEAFNIPSFAPTVDGSCGTDPDALAHAADRGWWTCGGYTRPTDITACPDKLTWGVSFDDGPGPYSTQLLEFLFQKNISSTFFVIGSRIIERPAVLVEEYMGGHEISVHTWSHRPLTSLTNEQIVAELGWTRKAIKAVIGVTPTTMRPPFGDIDDRVRAISLAMGLVPVIWTRTPSGSQFDTNDWKVPGGVVTGPESFSTFQSILGNATIIDTGFVVLQHDLYASTVDLAVGYTLPLAMSFNPHLTLEPIGQCNKIPESNLYRESNTNTTFPYKNATSGDPSIPVSPSQDTSGTNSTNAASDALNPIYNIAAAAGIVMSTILLT